MRRPRQDGAEAAAFARKGDEALEAAFGAGNAEAAILATAAAEVRRIRSRRIAEDCHSPRRELETPASATRRDGRERSLRGDAGGSRSRRGGPRCELRRGPSGHAAAKLMPAQIGGEARADHEPELAAAMAGLADRQPSRHSPSPSQAGSKGASCSARSSNASATSRSPRPSRGSRAAPSTCTADAPADDLHRARALKRRLGAWSSRCTHCLVRRLLGVATCSPGPRLAASAVVMCGSGGEGCSRASNGGGAPPNLALLLGSPSGSAAAMGPGRLVRSRYIDYHLGSQRTITRTIACRRMLGTTSA